MTSIRGKDVTWAGILAGLIYLILVLVMVWLFREESPWALPRMIAGIVLGLEAVPPPAIFDFRIVLMAVLLHLVFSLLYTFLLALIIHKMHMWMALVVGAAFGLGLYLLNFYLFTGIFPWFADARHWVNIFAHLMFGIVAALTYKTLVSRDMYEEEAPDTLSSY